jgi:hypothetical protein
MPGQERCVSGGNLLKADDHPGSELIERAVQNGERNPDTRLLQQTNTNPRLVLRA